MQSQVNPKPSTPLILPKPLQHIWAAFAVAQSACVSVWPSARAATVAVNQQCDMRKVKYSAPRTTIHSNYRLTTNVSMLSSVIIKSGANGCGKIIMKEWVRGERLMVILEVDFNLNCWQVWCWNLLGLHIISFQVLIPSFPIIFGMHWTLAICSIKQAMAICTWEPLETPSLILLHGYSNGTGSDKSCQNALNSCLFFAVCKAALFKRQPVLSLSLSTYFTLSALREWQLG